MRDVSCSGCNRKEEAVKIIEVEGDGSISGIVNIWDADGGSDSDGIVITVTVGETNIPVGMKALVNVSDGRTPDSSVGIVIDT